LTSPHAVEVHGFADLAPAAVPAALADLHAEVPLGRRVQLVLPVEPGRRWALDMVVGGGFDDVAMPAVRSGGSPVLVDARRARTLADRVGAGMRLLVCGLNPSLYAADRGIGFARPGNRFWLAALASGVATKARDPHWLLDVDCVGMTDLVKRATVSAAELAPAEYRCGVARVERLVCWLQPGAVCFVGLAGWRAAVDRNAVAGVVAGGFAGRPAYVMPNTSGHNARSRLADLSVHLRAAAALADAPSPLTGPPMTSRATSDAPRSPAPT
jgi:TDG/mug DNA glycosylase family protein